MGLVMGLYAVDALFSTCTMTHKIADSHWLRLTTGVQLTFADPPGWNTNTLGFVNIAVPWVSKTQCESDAFSIVRWQFRSPQGGLRAPVLGLCPPV